LRDSPRGAEFRETDLVRAAVQRVSSASVSVADEIVAAFGPGLLILVGLAVHDGASDADALAHRARLIGERAQPASRRSAILEAPHFRA
jgi:D-tyrosyl-tRNA(Tyr) deacylase